MSSYNTSFQPGEAVAPCCSTTTLLSALAASFACCFFLVVIFLCLRFLHLRRTRRHSAQPLQGQLQAPQPKHGLDAATIALFPSFPYRRDSSASAPDECAVCLSAVDEGETVRQLPSCKHLFHQECVDVWLLSNASCPVCRGKVERAAGADQHERAAASAAVVPIEMMDDETPSTSEPSVPERPGWFGGRASGSRSGQETDLERQ
ncbi:E3 ubiquitin-protein ligase ATL41-like [Aegilops tauschii subsp. strangulata]